ncbi:MAG: acetyl-CoA C-acetyltransferase [Candidatus Marinimicrobia bacterium]|nr:acetyl-CoA C-acetyltransferase [Candidatus Neomarinimicrobiota bacterium]
MSNLKEVVIIDAVRTAVGSFNGVLSSVQATELGSVVIKALLERNKLSSDGVDEVIMGNVIPAGEGQSPARQATLGSGLNVSTQTMTINKVCGSGLKAVMLADQAIKTGDADIIIAGGMESMSNIPYYLPKSRQGYRMGHQKVIDGMIHDGLWDVYTQQHMGVCSEGSADDEKLTREEMDEYAVMSYTRAHKAQEKGSFDREIVSVSIPQRKGDPVVVDKDEEPGNVKFEKITKLRPAFRKDGRITAANASKINDGAAAILIMSADKAKELGLKPKARILAQVSIADIPEKFSTAPISAIDKILKKAKLTVEDIDLWEINEAFSHVAFLPIKKFGIDINKVNIHGGAVAIGHPIGASGARILTTLIHAMDEVGAKRGLATLCIGGGEASALIIERI